ncbi:MAG: class I SAM-dependent methyltransferase [Pseudomonadota bacterium]
MNAQTVFTKGLRRTLWLALEAQRRVQLAPRPQYALEYIGYLRHVQHVRETGARQNPDSHVGRFFSPIEKMLARAEDIDALRTNPVYHYVLTRTLHYDRIITDAITDGFEQLVFFGVGADTRSFRFCGALDSAGVRVIETDMEPWLSARIGRCDMFQRPQDFHQVEFIIGETDPQTWKGEAGFDAARRTLFIAEGVTPYLDVDAHGALLSFVSAHAPAGSRLAYDGKYTGAGAGAPSLFRMPRDPDDIAAMLNAAGLKAESITPSAEAQVQLASYEAPVFDEDVFMVATIA